MLGARVVGFSLEAEPESLFHSAEIQATLSKHIIGDIRDASLLTNAIQKAQPDVLFHLAAQPLVRDSYLDPVGTFETNVMGTCNVLEAARSITGLRSIVAITTDKVYENHEWVHPYRETDALGGHDPYSTSKACAELVSQSYYRSFFKNQSDRGLATARAGNVIGGGDWADHRLIPDLMRSFLGGSPAILRNPKSIRPWQHVLEPLSGYLALAEHLYRDPPKYSRAFNFGPDEEGCQSVEVLARGMAKAWKTVSGQEATIEFAGNEEGQPHEAGILKLDASLARSMLPWKPRWSMKKTVEQVADWYHRSREGGSMREYTEKQIKDYISH